MNQSRKRHRAAVTLFTLAAVPCAVQQALAAQVDANYTGSSGGGYGTASNWDVGEVPLNNAMNTYSVTISGGKTVNYTVTTPHSIDELLLDLGTTFNLSSSSFVSPTDLTVLGRALIGGTINADGALFTAVGAGTAFAGAANSVTASNGGVVRIGAPVFDASGLSGRAIISATGTGSSIDLSSVQLLNVGQGGGNPNSINVTGGGKVDLSGVKTLVAPAFGQSLNLNVNSGGDVKLSSLQTLGGVTADTGYTQFFLDGGTATVGPLKKANRLNVSLTNASTMDLGGYVGQADITNSKFLVTGGSKLNASALVGKLDDAGITGTPVLSADGNNSLLNLSGIQILSFGQSGGNPNSINATGGGKIDLSGVKTLVAPAFGQTMQFIVNSGGNINMSSLQTLGGVTSDTGYTQFSLDDGTATVGPLQKANRLNVSLTNASTMNLGGYAGEADITNSKFLVAGGSKLNASALVGKLDDAGITGAPVLSADGDNSLLNLSGIQILSFGQSGGNPNSINATGGGKIDLSGVKTLVAPAFGQTLNFNVNSGGNIDMSSLQTLGGVTVDTGYTQFLLDGSTATVGPLQKANRLNVSLNNAATMTIGGYAGQADITNSKFYVAGGASLNASALIGKLDDGGVSGTTLLSAAGSGSVLNLSGLRVLSVALTGGNPNVIAASAGGKIDLSGLTTIAGATFTQALNFNATGASLINLNSLQSLDTQAGGIINFNVSGGSTLQMRGSTVPARVNFNLTDAPSVLQVTGDLRLLAGSALAAGAGTTIAMHGSYTFEQRAGVGINTDAAVMSFAGGGFDTLEVGGKRLALPSNGSIINGNFALGQLVVGQTGEVTIVTLADAVDNGNRNPTEVLYLNGLGSGSNGLRILGGSTLVIGSIDLYMSQNGQWQHVNDLFPNGEHRIAYDQGFISITAVPEPATWALWGFGLLGLALRRRRSEAERAGGR